MPEIDRISARALTDAGFMPLGEHIRLFGDEVAASADCKPEVLYRPWRAPRRSEKPLRRNIHHPNPLKRRTGS
jgi:hypothetical protein